MIKELKPVIQKKRQFNTMDRAYFNTKLQKYTLRIFAVSGMYNRQYSLHMKEEKQKDGKRTC